MIRLLYVGPKEGAAAIRDYIPDSINVVVAEPKPDIVSKELREVHALIDASMKVPITAEMIAKAKNLRIISTATTGSDHIDHNSLKEKSIVLTTLKEDSDFLKNITPAAEHSWALLLALARKLPNSLASVKAGQWSRQDFPSIMLNGKTLGIVGCGRIGQWMARYGNAFGMEVQGYDPYVKPWPEHIVKMNLAHLFTSSDFITVHVHLTDETRGLIDWELFNNVKKGAIFINTSRGAITDEKALLEALETGRLSGAGLDVLYGEPSIGNHPLVQYARTNDNLLITPHCGGYSPDAVRLVCQRAAEKIMDYFQNRKT